jgi:hypothetical protein
MKQTILFISYFIFLALISCKKPNEEKAKEAIRTYLNENLNDNATYESVKFGKLDTLFQLDVTGTSFATADNKYIFHYQMFHSYRLKDEKGKKYLTKTYFELNNNFDVVHLSDYSSKVEGEKPKILRIPSDKEVKEFGQTVVADTAEFNTSSPH